MPWDDAIEAEYDALIDGVVGQATDLPTWWLGSGVKQYLIQLESGGAANLSITPASFSHLTGLERLLLHSMRIACAMYVERNGFFPWRLVDHPVEELRPLVSYHYQGLRESDPGEHVFHHVWDAEPGLRMAEAVFAFFIADLFGLDMPGTEAEMVAHFVQWMRDAGWVHMTGSYDDLEGYPDHGGHVYDFDAFTEVKRSGCHATADYMAAGLRHFNVPAHYGRGWSGEPPTGNEYWGNVHQHGHCFLHFPTEGWWMSHADDVYSAIWKTVPPELAMMSRSWMDDHHFDQSQYTWSRGRAEESNLWWCFLIGRSSTPTYDVPTLYANGTLRERLETLHIEYELADRDGAPADVPPVFDDDTVDALMSWVAFVLAEH